MATICLFLAAGCSTGAVQGPTPVDESPTVQVNVPTPTRTPVTSYGGLTPAPPDPVTESALKRVKETGKIRVGILYNYPPLGYLSENGQIKGYEADLIRRVAEYWGVDVEFIQVTRQTRMAMLYNGDVDILAAAVPHRRELEQFVTFSDTTFRGGYVALVPNGGAADLETVLSNGAVAAVNLDSRDVVERRAGDLGVITVETVVFDTMEDAIEALRTDDEITSVVGRRELLMLPGYTRDDLILLEKFVLPEPLAFAVRKGDVPMRDLINVTLRRLIADAEIGSIFSTNFYGLPADVFPERLGESNIDFDTYSADIPEGELIIDRIRAGNPLRVAGLELSDSPPPYAGQPIIDGYNRAIVNEMARRWDVGVTEMPSSTGMAGVELLNSGQADLLVGVRPDLTLSGRLSFSHTYYQRGLRLIHMEDVLVLSVRDLDFKPAVAITPVDISEDIIRDNNQFPEVETATSHDEALSELLARGVYAIVGDEYTVTLLAQTDDRIEMDSERYRPTDHVMALPRYDTDFLALVNMTLQNMYLDGTLDRLREQYLVPYLPEGTELSDLNMEIWPGDGSYLNVR